MLKKILFTTFFTLSTISFSQENTVNHLLASPNPFTFSTKISFNADEKIKVLFMVKNILGKTVYKKEYNTKIGENLILFERENLKPGMYIYAIQSDKEIISKRFVIK